MLDQVETVEFDEPHDFDGAGTVTFIPAGHILGAAIVDLRMRSGGTQSRLVCSGDLGVHNARLRSPPETVQTPDYLIMESTYGDRNRADEGDRTEQLFQIIDRTTRRKGKVIIPSFAVGRSQEMLDEGDAPLSFDGLKLITSVEDSIALNCSTEPAVIISASGMCTAGRVKDHLKFNLSDSKNTVLFVGYQAQRSLGRIIQSETSPVRIFGEWYPVEAQIETNEGFSAHAATSSSRGSSRWENARNEPSSCTGRKTPLSALPGSSSNDAVPTSWCPRSAIPGWL